MIMMTPGPQDMCRNTAAKFADFRWCAMPSRRVVTRSRHSAYDTRSTPTAFSIPRASFYYDARRVEQRAQRAAGVGVGAAGALDAAGAAGWA